MHLHHEASPPRISRPVGTLAPFGQSLDPAGRLAQFMRCVADFERDEMEAAVDGLIALMDARDGDADLEPTGDEMDAAWPEGRQQGAQTPMAIGFDHAMAHEDAEDCGDLRDASFPEWRPWQPATPRMEAGMSSALGHEDAEDCDSDRCVAGDDHMIAGPVAQRDWWERYDQHSGAMPGGDDDQERPCPPAWQINQTLPLMVTAANDWQDYAA
ncbi:hypothetical protein SAMN05192583_0559 [Sphingomonas gellani]|uniref:Uncharacterized protein n=1 Tax=Sphingomonas gellani TaxID=1166340 RepID=A0A1H7Z7N3_9SPHN|nr:hypothetical protein [Sphingomonas gellani]SEM54024.1 hypothetical protein SAMN05192583_0559 [Sphingomonas gellani]